VMMGPESIRPRPWWALASVRASTDVDAHFERARASGARVVYPPEDTEWGTRRCRALVQEGYEWSFGNYPPGTVGNS
jgi:uncharacterized glyoxalase superfamily protein PhnB